MFRTEPFKKFFCSLFSGLYLFAVLFAQNLHNHGSGHFFKDFHFQTNGNSFSKSHSAHDPSDCMSCHFASENNAEVPLVFTVSPVDLRIHTLPSDDVQSVYLYKNRELSSQRGPPSLG